MDAGDGPSIAQLADAYERGDGVPTDARRAFNLYQRAAVSGDPEAMGLEEGWTREKYREESIQRDPQGRQMQNVCLGCDAFFAKHLKGEIERLRADRLARR